MGLALARGLDIAAAKREIGQEVEGVATAREVRSKAQLLGVEMPITEQTYRVLFQGLEPSAAVQNLLSREARRESY
jgi:glycerol-3-phosphate dehydrogenase (NAD(P)+)